MALPLHPDDVQLAGLVNQRVPSSIADRSYQVLRPLGAGGMAVVFLALRHDPRGISPVVLKILTPRFVSNTGNTAMLSFMKEANALSALNERVPPSPHVVRLLDAGTLNARLTSHPSEPGKPMGLGWLALEYIHGDAEGTTLTERVRYSVARTRFAFEPLRAVDCIRNITSGLSVVHELGILHRDLKPTNVLCTGFGDRETFKIVDFGIARSAEAGTFMDAGIGTPGYSAPEQIYSQGAKLGPPCDVFGFGSLTYYILTGRPLFRFETLIDMVRVVGGAERDSVCESEHLSLELRSHQGACAAVDAAIARATSANPSQRPATAEEYCEEITRALLIPTGLGRSTLSRMPAFSEQSAPSRGGWQWLTRQRPFEPGYAGPDVVVNAAFDGASGCLATTTHALMYWDGGAWRAVPSRGGAGLDAVSCTSAGQWLVTSRDGGVHHFSYHGLSEIVRGEGYRFQRLSGVLRQLLVLVSQPHQGGFPSGPPVLHRLTQRGMLPPLPLEHFASVNDLARLDTMRWLVVGRSTQGHGLVAIFRAVDGVLDWLKVPDVAAYLACTTNPDVGDAVVVGTEGTIVHLDDNQCRAERMGAPVPLSVVCMDPSGGTWAATTGSLFYRAPGIASRWQCPWHDPSWTTPFNALHASGGVVLALTADGAILEGLSQVQSQSSVSFGGVA